MEFRHCSLWKQHWAPVGLFGRTVVPLDKAPAHHCPYFPGWLLNRGPQNAQSRAQKLLPAGLLHESSPSTLIAPFVVYHYGFAER
jgi:hypothetical protein